MKKLALVIITFIFYITNVPSQEIKLDSILKILDKQPDTVIVQSLIDYYNEF